MCRGMLLAGELPLWYTSWCWEELKDRWEQCRHREGPMSRAPLHALIWSKEHLLYELYTQSQIQQRFQPVEEAAWLAWLHGASSFAFHGARGSLNVYQEQRPRGGAYWYAYQTREGRTRKRYLGRTETLSLSRLEETAQMLLQSEQKPAQALDQGTLVLSGRLAPPRLPNALVERERLLLALDEALASPLTLLSAAAGFGKTTLLAAWASRQKTQVAWLSLDEPDNSPSRFWVALIAALRRCPSLTSSFGETVQALLESPQPPPLSTAVTALLHELESCEGHPAPIVLIIDDYQIIEDPAIHESLRLFLEHLPDHLHLILSSRVDPDLPLARLRVRGQLSEIRADELRFREVEASQYLGQMLSPTLSAEEVSQLVNRTEGWIAGLQLVTLTMQKREDRAAFLKALTGSQRYLLDYVQEEILARLPTGVRDFLLHCAILSQMSASVCQAVTASPTKAASQRMLVFLERANLFLVPLDEERHTYRLHDLFREALLATLHTTQPEMEPVLHRRAARFYEAQWQWHEAIAHALAGADYSTAVRLMEQTVEQFWLRGEATTMARWVSALPEQIVREHAPLLLTTALYLINIIAQTTREQRERRHKEVRQLMARVETALRQEHDKADQEVSVTYTEAGVVSSPRNRESHVIEEALLYRRLRLLHIQMVFVEALANGEHERLNSMQQKIEEELDHDEEAIWQIVPLGCSFILHYRFRGEGARLVPRLLAARERVSLSGSLFANARVRQWLTMAAVEAGQLRLAYQESLAALELIEQMAGYALLKGYLEVAQLKVLYQWNRLEEVRDRLQTVIQDAATWQQSDLLLSGYVFLMEVELARGDLSAVDLSLHELEQVEAYRGFAGHWRWLSAIRARCWLAQGQVREASDWATGLVSPQGVWETSLYHTFPVVIRVYFARQRWTEALSLLERFRSHLDRPANIRITITYLAQLLVALHHAGKSEQTRVVAARLFALTEPEGYLRVYLDEGEPMRQTLEALLPPHFHQHELASSTTAYISQLLAAFEQEQQGANISLVAIPSLAPIPSPARQASVVPSAPGASLTQREQEVLRLLSTGASNQDIARTLVIELPTVKKHVSNLLGKLGATSRTQAIALARARSLL
jgi:LuxR family maltose regulon positive regulatory protein